MQKGYSAVRHQKRPELAGAWQIARAEPQGKKLRSSTSKRAHELIERWKSFAPKWRVWIDESGTRPFSPDRSWYQWLGKADILAWNYGASASSAFTDLLHYYEHKRAATESSSGKSEIEKTLSEVHRNREILAALMQHDWLGLKILAHLRKSGRMRLVALILLTGADGNYAAAVIAKLVWGGAVIVDEDDSFICTDLGISILENLERNTGINLNPEA